MLQARVIECAVNLPGELLKIAPIVVVGFAEFVVAAACF